MSTSKAPVGVGARVFASVFFLFFMGLGLFFCGLIAREAVAGLRTWTWTKKACEIVSSEVREVDSQRRKTGNYYFQVRYSYDFGGHSYISDRYHLKPAAFQDYGKAARLIELYRPESATLCYVNPVNPTEAVLKRGNLLFPLALLFPLIFVMIGVLGVYSLWRPKLDTSPRTKPISDQGLRTTGRSVGVLFSLVFTVVGSVLLYTFLLRPCFKILSARHWPAVPCVILSSDVRSHRDSGHGATYSVNILYGYEFGGREFKANRYDFMGGSSSGSGAKYSIVAQHPPGSRTVCYVNPADPAEAVLKRGFTPTMWLGLIPFFVCAGGSSWAFVDPPRQQTDFEFAKLLDSGSRFRLRNVRSRPETRSYDRKRTAHPETGCTTSEQVYRSGIVCAVLEWDRFCICGQHHQELALWPL